VPARAQDSSRGFGAFPRQVQRRRSRNALADAHVLAAKVLAQDNDQSVSISGREVHHSCPDTPIAHFQTIHSGPSSGSRRPCGQSAADESRIGRECRERPGCAVVISRRPASGSFGPAKRQADTSQRRDLVNRQRSCRILFAGLPRCLRLPDPAIGGPYPRICLPSPINTQICRSS